MGREFTHIQGGERRLAEQSEGLTERLAGWNVKPSDYIPGFRISFRELDNIARWLRDEGWSGFIGLDEAVETYLPRGKEVR